MAVEQGKMLQHAITGAALGVSSQLQDDRTVVVDPWVQIQRPQMQARMQYVEPFQSAGNRVVYNVQWNGVLLHWHEMPVHDKV